jgi:hypothetical protein
MELSLLLRVALHIMSHQISCGLPRLQATVQQSIKQLSAGVRWQHVWLVLKAQAALTAQQHLLMLEHGTNCRMMCYDGHTEAQPVNSHPQQQQKQSGPGLQQQH